MSLVKAEPLQVLVLPGLLDLSHACTELLDKHCTATALTAAHCGLHDRQMIREVLGAGQPQLWTAR